MINTIKQELNARNIYVELSDIETKIQSYDIAQYKDNIRPYYNYVVWDKASDLYNRKKDDLLTIDGMKECEFPYFIQVLNNNKEEKTLYVQTRTTNMKFPLISFRNSKLCAISHIESLIKDEVYNCIIQEIVNYFVDLDIRVRSEQANKISILEQGLANAEYSLMMGGLL